MKHIIYGLIDPDTLLICYVGRTQVTGRPAQAARERLQQHLQAAHRGETKPVYVWIRSLTPAEPSVTVLEIVSADDGRHPNNVQSRETAWIKRLERYVWNEVDHTSRAYRRLVNPPR